MGDVRRVKFVHQVYASVQGLVCLTVPAVNVEETGVEARVAIVHQANHARRAWAFADRSLVA